MRIQHQNFLVSRCLIQSSSALWVSFGVIFVVVMCITVSKECTILRQRPLPTLDSLYLPQSAVCLLYKMDQLCQTLGEGIVTRDIERHSKVGADVVMLKTY